MPKRLLESTQLDEVESPDEIPQGDVVWSTEDENRPDEDGDGGDSSVVTAEGLVGIEPLPEYVPISSVETANATEFDQEAVEELMVDADYADEPELFGKIAQLVPKVIKGAGRVVRNPVVQAAVKAFLSAKGIRLEAAALSDEPSLLEVVIGADDRIKITSTAARPWSGICQLNITARNGQRFIGTGWLIAPRTVITAGHCVYIHNAGGWVREVEVSPGRNGATRPFGAVKSGRVSSTPQWVASRDRNHDYGCIILPRAPKSATGALPFCFNYAARSEAQIRSRALNLSGYPGDKGGITQWFHARMAKAVSNFVITYDIDTAGGQSGSPVWHFQNNIRTAVGIHTNGSPLGNSATRITPTVAARLNTWKAAGG